MSSLWQAISKHLTPVILSPEKPIILTIRSRLGGTRDTHRLKAPYPKHTAPYSRRTVVVSTFFASASKGNFNSSATDLCYFNIVMKKHYIQKYNG